MNLQQTRFILAIAAAGVLLGGCGGGSSNGSKGIPPISSVNPIGTGTLEFAVGTANIFGTNTGLNVVSTYRQSNGISNVLVDTPTITGPFTLPPAVAVQPGYGVDTYSTVPAANATYITPATIAGLAGPPPSAGGPSAQEVAVGGEIIGTSQLLPAGTPLCDQATPCNVTGANNATGTVQPNSSTFGSSGGVFVNGLSPANSTNQGVANSYVPFSEPIYDTTNTTTQQNTFYPWGGPPAFDPNKDGMGLRDGLNNLGKGVLGIPEGLSVFENVRLNGAGTYTMSLQVPTGFNGPTPTTSTVSATARLASTATLPTITAPTLTLDNKGGASFTIAALPAGVTEEYVQIADIGAGGAAGALNPKTNGIYFTCQEARGPQFAPVYYTIVVHAAGTYTLPDNDGPNTNTTGGTTGLTPSPSICTAAQNAADTAATGNNPQPGGPTTIGDSYTVQAFGTDYPLYEATYPITTSASPTLTGTAGQSDITISLPITGTSP